MKYNSAMLIFRSYLSTNLKIDFQDFHRFFPTLPQLLVLELQLREIDY